MSHWARPLSDASAKQGTNQRHLEPEGPHEESEGNIKEEINCSRGSWANPPPNRLLALSRVSQTTECLLHHEPHPALCHEQSAHIQYDVQNTGIKCGKALKNKNTKTTVPQLSRMISLPFL